MLLYSYDTMYINAYTETWVSNLSGPDCLFGVLLGVFPFWVGILLYFPGVFDWDRPFGVFVEFSLNLGLGDKPKLKNKMSNVYTSVEVYP